MNRHQWAERANEIIQALPPMEIGIPLDIVHIFVCAAIVAANDPRQDEIVRKMFSDIAAQTAAQMTVAFPQLDEIYSNIPVTNEHL